MSEKRDRRDLDGDGTIIHWLREDEHGPIKSQGLKLYPMVGGKPMLAAKAAQLTAPARFVVACDREIRIGEKAGKHRGTGEPRCVECPDCRCTPEYLSDERTIALVEEDASFAAKLCELLVARGVDHRVQRAEGNLDAAQQNQCSA